MITELDILSLPSLPLEQRSHLPDAPAVYFVLSEGRVLYIGQTMRLLRRLSTHHHMSEFAEYPGVTVTWLAVETSATQEELLRHEQMLIKQFRPAFNGRQSAVAQNTRARSDEVAQAARLILDQHVPTSDQQIPLAELAPILIDQTGCHPNTARRALTRAMHARHGQTARGWGGARAGAGNPALKKKVSSE